MKILISLVPWCPAELKCTCFKSVELSLLIDLKCSVKRLAMVRLVWPTYCRPHTEQLITHMRLEDRQDTCIFVLYCTYTCGVTSNLSTSVQDGTKNTFPHFSAGIRDDIKSCEKNSILNSFKIRGREGVRLGCHV